MVTSSVALNNGWTGTRSTGFVLKRIQEVDMEELNKRIHDDSNGLDYVLAGDYYIPDLTLPEESRPIGRWGRMHRLF